MLDVRDRGPRDARGRPELTPGGPQLVAALSYGDPSHEPGIRATPPRGFESDIFAERVHPRMAHLARPLGIRRCLLSETVVLFHFSIGARRRPLSRADRS